MEVVMPHAFDGSDDRDLGPNEDPPCAVCGAPESEYCRPGCDCNHCEKQWQLDQERKADAALERG